MKPSIAILLSGQMRTAKICFPSIKRHLLDQLPAYDLFAHIAADNDQSLIELFNPQTAKVENPETFAENNYIHHTGRSVTSSIQGVLTQFWRLEKVYELMCMEEQRSGHTYSFCIRLRPDLQLFNNPEPWPAEDVPHIRVPRFGSAWGYNDRFAMGTRREMGSYFSCFNDLNTLMNEGCVFHPESIIKFQLERNRVPVWYTDLIFDIIRKDATRYTPTWNEPHGDALPPWRAAFQI